jgi:hypothetical protein
MMAAQLAVTCEIHELEDCPDSVIGHWRKSGEYGLRIHDGGASMILIDYCPWCRTRLRPKSRGPLVTAGRFGREALPEGIPLARVPRRGGPVPGRRIERD